MSELTGVLLLLAAALLVALYLYGKWQVRRSSPLEDAKDEVSSAPQSARSMRHPPTRIEPTLGTLGARADAIAATDHRAGEESAPSVGGWIEDPLLDVTLELRCTHAFDGVAALEARAQLDRLALPLPTHVAVWDTKIVSWSVPDRFGFYSEMLIALQLATRRHSLGEIDAARFVAAVQQIALSIDADFDPPDVARIVAQATELDRLCARFDVQITLTLQAQGATWNDEVVGAAARDAQLVQLRPGFWRSASDQLPLSMASTSTGRLALTLDVPLASDSPPPVRALFDAAQNLAQRLDAQVVDDNGRAVEAEARSTIETELQTLRAEMRAAGIEPGSVRARRLYFE